MKKFLSRSALLCLVLICLCQCATKGSQTISRDREFERMLDLQRQKANATAKDTESTKLPEMGAEDHDRLGSRYERQGNQFLALMEYQKALRVDPNRVLTRYKMGHILMRRGLEEEALKEFGIIEDKQPACGLGALGKGVVAFQKGEMDESQNHLTRALGLNGRLWQAHMFLGLILERQKDFDGAIKHHHEALAISPGLAALHNNLGMAYYRKGEYANSVEEYLKALQIDPDNKRVYNNLGLSLVRIGRHDEALSAFKKGNDEAAAYNNIGYIYLTEGKYGQATQALEKAIRISPRHYVKAYENMERAASQFRLPLKAERP